VKSTEGKIYILRHNEVEDEWTLQSAFDGAELMVRPNTKIIAIDEETIARAEAEIDSCEACNTAAGYHSIGFLEK